MESRSFIARSNESTLRERLTGLGILDLDGTHDGLVDRIYEALKERPDLQEVSSDIEDFGRKNRFAGKTNYAARASRSDHYFISGSIFRNSASRFARGGPRPPYRGRPQSFTAPQSGRPIILLCFRWNEYAFTASAATCKYPHVCQNCGAGGHRKDTCVNGQTSRQNNAL